MKPSLIVRLVQRLVPLSWRGAVSHDLADEARAGGKSEAWVAARSLEAGLRLRIAIARDALASDVRCAARSLLRARWFTLGAVATFALGIGANVAVLSVVDRMLFRPLPYGDPATLVQVHLRTVGTGPEQFLAFDLGLSSRWMRLTTLVDGLAYADALSDPTVMDGLGREPVQVANVTANLLDVLRVQPEIGRSFTQDDSNAHRRVALISDGLWRSRFGGSAEVLGQRIGTPPRSLEIVGVLPPGFLLPSSSVVGRVDVLAMLSLAFRNGIPDGAIATAPIARLKPGVTVEAAFAELASVVAQARTEMPAVDWALSHGAKPEILPVQTGLFLLYRPYLILITIAVALLLAVATVNLSALFVARGRSREQETAVRAALGASPGRLLAGALAEVALTCTAGAIVAVLLFAALRRGLLAVVPPRFQAYTVGAFDGRLLTLTTLVTVVCTVLAAFAPAFRSRSVPAIDLLRRTSRHTPAPRSAWVLLATQSALGILLVCGAAVTVRNFVDLATEDPGYRAEGLWLGHIQHGIDVDRTAAVARGAPPGTAAVTLARYHAIGAALRSQPTIQSFGLATGLQLLGRGPGKNDFWPAHGVTNGGVWGVGAGVFETLGTRVLAGRTIGDDDVVAGALVAVLNERAAAALWPGDAPADLVGREIGRLGQDHRVIGVVADLHPYPGMSATPALFVPMTDPLATRNSDDVTAVLRAAPNRALDSSTFEAALNRQMGRGSATLVSLAGSLEPAFQQPRFQAALFSLLAAFALILMVVGLYAVASYDVARRRHEMGVRTALGASAGELWRSVLGGTLAPVLTGGAIGLAGCWWAARFLQTFTVEVDARDPWTYAVVLVAIVTTAALAAAQPAARAARTDPAEVLRQG